MRSFYHLLLLFSFVLLSGCGSKALLTAIPTLASPTPISTSGVWASEASLLLEYPCNAPCFLGITVGRTKSQDILSILRQNGITNCSKRETYVSCSDLGYSTGIAFDDEVVTGMSFQPKLPIHVETLIHTLGPPDHVAVIDRTFVTDSPTTDLYFYYDKHLMTFFSGQHKGPSVDLNKDTFIFAWSYSNSSDYQRDLSNWAEAHDPFPSHVSNWEGYGFYTP